MTSPTIVPYKNFDAIKDCHVLRAAMKGLGTDEQAIIDILTARSNDQRQQIARSFHFDYGRDLIKDLKSELSGRFRDVILALMDPPITYLCKELHKAMSGIRTKESALMEILCTKTHAEKNKILKTYEELYQRPLVGHLCSETSGSFGCLLTLIVSDVRYEGTLYDSKVAPLWTDKEFEEVRTRCKETYDLREISILQRSIDRKHKEFKQAITNEMNEMNEQLKNGALAEEKHSIVGCSTGSLATFFASRIFKAVKGLGTDDSTLIRIIVSRSEIDLNEIKQEFERMHHCTLLSAVKDDTSGDYMRALCAIIGGA